jgi:Xaa-Pro aminopeptidase
MYQTTKMKTYGFEKEKLVGLMKDFALQGVLLTTPENIYYTTGYPVVPSAGNPILFTLRNMLPSFVYINADGARTLFCWVFSSLGMEFEVEQLVEFRDFNDALQKLKLYLTTTFNKNTKLGIESSCPYYVLKLIQELVDPGSLLLADKIISSLRLIKSEQELEIIQKGTEIIERTLSDLYTVIHMGMSRLELMKESKSMLFKNGITGLSHLTYSFGKTNPEIAIDEIVEEGDLITLDIGGKYLGYSSDNRRYMFAGPVPDAVLDHYRLMVDIIDKIGEALIPGTSYADLFELANDLFTKYDLIPDFNRIGHNMGLETEEEWIMNDPKLAVQKNMVINLELYTFAKTGQLIGNEETYIIGETGPTRITHLAREIRMIE